MLESAQKQVRVQEVVPADLKIMVRIQMMILMKMRMEGIRQMLKMAQLHLFPEELQEKKTTRKRNTAKISRISSSARTRSSRNTLQTT